MQHGSPTDSFQSVVRKTVWGIGSAGNVSNGPAATELSVAERAELVSSSLPVQL